MQPYTHREKARITAGAIAALVTTGMLFAITMGLLLAM
jgi:hypothetical protein